MYSHELNENLPRTLPTSPTYKSAACKYAPEGPYRQCACLFTVTVGKENVGVGVMLGVRVNVGVKVIVGVSVIVDVAVASKVAVSAGVFVSVGGAGVAVSACDGSVHASNPKIKTRIAAYLFIIQNSPINLLCFFPGLRLRNRLP